jgi:hypothetical protein
MELVDRYLRAVEFWLPEDQRSDVVDELSDDIRSQIEERAAELGIEPGQDDVAAILKRRGHPMMVAANYRPHDYLVGPLLLPLYKLALRVVILCILAPTILLVLAPAAVIGGAGPFGVALGSLFELGQAALFAVGIVTIVFALAERYGLSGRLLRNWDPRRLVILPTYDGRRRESLFAALISLTFRVAFGTWWLTVMWRLTVMSSGTLYAGRALQLTFAPAWHGLFWPILAIVVAGIANDVVSLCAPTWERPRAFVEVALACANLAVVGFLLHAGTWFTVTAANASPTELARVQGWINLTTEFTLFATAAIVLAIAITNVRRILRGPGVTRSV